MDNELGICYKFLGNTYSSESELEYQGNLAHSLEERVENLESTLNATIDVLQKVVVALESEHNKDFDGDGQVG